MNNPPKRPPGRPHVSESDIPKDQLILQTATRLFIDQGYQKVSIDDISNACGVTKATVYYYFKSKSVLFMEAMVQMMERITQQIMLMMEKDKPFREKLYDVTLAHLKATTTFDMEGYMREIKTLVDPKQIEKIKAAEDRMYEAISETIMAEVKEGKIKDLNTMFAAQAFVSLIKVGHYQQKDGTLLFKTPEEAAQNIVDFYWDGIKR